ncbi:MAG: putative metal-binding motif-containing protein [Myxococcota bacterium]
MVRIALLALVLVACNKDKGNGGNTGGGDDTGTAGDDTGSTTDADGDLVSVADGDCDDTDPDVNPNEEEVWYDGVDQDCDGNDDDRDYDGFSVDEDCNDLSTAQYPGAEETCNELDDDCDGDVDEEAVDSESAFADADGDGFGDGATSTLYCGEVPDGYTLDGSDCDDARAHVHPFAPEVCDDVDNDCDGSLNEDSPLPITWYEDVDGDGHGVATGATQIACDPPAGFAVAADDCDDADATVSPSADETCDDVDRDCDGDSTNDPTDGTTFYTDADADGFGDLDAPVVACAQPEGGVNDATDCDDASPASFPGSVEVCDGLDNDCNGVRDDGLVAGTFYADDDGDGYGSNFAMTEACVAPPGWTDTTGDCDDADGAVSPSATEVCDGADNDCDTYTDEDGSGTATWYADVDGDGYGDAGLTMDQCAQPDGYVLAAGDCDDTSWLVNPDAVESCDGADNDCDLSVDEADAVGAITWYTDFDGDDYGDLAAPYAACAVGDGVANSSDCDDGNAATSPGASEICDDADNDCDGAADEDVPTSIWYGDADLDGHGDPASPVEDCEQPDGTADDDLDCDDADAAVSPDADELCNALDDDCDGATDEDDAVDAGTFYADADADGYGDATNAANACTLPAGYVADQTDCDDGDAAVNPAATEVCNADVDDDCDGVADSADPDLVDGADWYTDGDGDGFGDAFAVNACEAAAGTVAVDGDCDDASASVFPGAPETCNDLDDDCDGSVDDGAPGDTWYADADGDGYGDPVLTTEDCSAPVGYVGTAGDCDDTSAGVNPAATETCDGEDDDCDGTADDGATGGPWYADGDGDGYGDPVMSDDGCSAPSGYVSDDSDCDDGDAAVSPAADEVCNGLDDNCSGDTADEAGSAAYEDTSGAWTDVSATLAAGTSADPAIIGDRSTYDLYVTDGTLHVCEGTWNVKVVTSSGSTDLTIVGEAGPDATTLTTGGVVNGSVVSVTSGIVNLEGVTISGGLGSSGTTGGGVIVGEYTARQAVPNVTLTDCIVTGNSTQYGGGLAIYNYGWIELVDTLVDGNTASSAGGGLWVQNYGYLSCSATTLGAAGFVGNTSSIGSGVYLSSSAGGGLDTVGCDWGDTGTADDNSSYDIQWNPRSTRYWCYGDATSLSDAVSCTGGSCTTSTEACP